MRLHSLSGQPVPVLGHPHSKKVFPYAQMEHSYVWVCAHRLFKSEGLKTTASWWLWGVCIDYCHYRLGTASPFPLPMYPEAQKMNTFFPFFTDTNSQWHSYLQVYRCPFFSDVVPTDELWSDCFTPVGLISVIISEFGTNVAHKPII